MSAKKMRIEILAIGSELLTPYYQDTNSLYLTQKLNELGLQVSSRTIVGDEWEGLALKIKESLRDSDIVMAIGGLGPTDDDRTREAFAKALGRRLVLKEDLLLKIEERFKRRGIPMPAPNRKQAAIIEGSEPLENKNGTAPGLWLETDDKKIVLLPGPPHELMPMFEEAVWPRLQKFRKSSLVRKTLKIAGLAESAIECLIKNLYPKDPKLEVTLLAYPGQIEIHITSASDKGQVSAEKAADRLERQFRKRLGMHIFSRSGEELEEVVGNLLRETKKTLAVAESCTGGFLSHRLTNIPGSSDYFLEAAVSYSNRAKMDLLGVPASLIEKHGAVSPQVAEAMAKGVRARARSDYGLAVTGIAGPSGGTPEKPIGLVYTALTWERGTEVLKNLFPGKREQIKFQSSQKALDMLRLKLMETKGARSRRGEKR